MCLTSRFCASCPNCCSALLKRFLRASDFCLNGQKPLEEKLRARLSPPQLFHPGDRHASLRERRNVARNRAMNVRGRRLEALVVDDVRSLNEHLFAVTEGIISRVPEVQRPKRGVRQRSDEAADVGQARDSGKEPI